MIAIDLSKQQDLDADLRAIQQIHFTANLDRVGNKTMFSFMKNKRNCFGPFTRNCKSFVNLLYNNLVWFNIISI